MEKDEEENGGENNPNNTNGDGDTLDSGGNGSDETGVTDPAVQAKENGTAVVTNESPEQSDNNPAQDATEHNTVPPEVPVKTDTSKSKQEPGPGSSSNVSEQTDNPPTQDGSADDKIRSEAANKTVSPTSSDSGCSPLGPKPGLDQDTRRPADAPLVDHKEPVANKREVNETQNSDSSSKGTEPKTEEEKKQNTERGDRDDPDSVEASVAPSLYDGTSASDTPEQNQNLDAGPGPTPDLPEDASRTMSLENRRTAQPLPTTDSSVMSVEALKLKANEKLQKSNAQTPVATDTSITTSERTGNTNVLRSEGTGSISVNEPMKEPPATKDNGASQPEGGVEFQIAVDTTSGKTGVSLKIVKPKNSGENRAPPPENKQGSENLQSKSGSSAPGGKCAEETEAQQIDAKGKSNKEEERETGAGANKDDDKEVRLKEKKAKGEGVEGEGGTTDAVKTMQHVIKERSVSISICSSAYSFNVEGLVSYLNRLMKKHPELIKKVKFHELPYNDLDNYRFDEKDPVDVMILCHSINNRRFAITDVMDALYDAYLPYCARVIGKEKMGVIVHDFDDMREVVQSSRMSSFKYKQPKAFETTSLQITCGHIEKEEQVLKQMLKEDRKKIFEFLKNASKHPEKIMTLRDIETTGQKVKRVAKQAGVSLSSFFSWGTGSNEAQRSSSQQRQEIPQHKHPPSDQDTGEPKPEKKIHDAYVIISSATGSIEAQRSSTQQATAVPPTYNAPDVDTGETKPDEKFLDAYGRKNDNSQPTKRARDESQPSHPNAKRTDLLRSDPAGDVAQVRQQSLSSLSQMPSASGSVVTSAPQRSQSQPTPFTEPRSTTVSICSSAYEHNVKGLVSWLTAFKAKHPHKIADVRFRELPYNDIDSFRFPPDDPVDVMILCHSIQNRGFSITNVLNALYEKYLKYCHDVIGKTKLAVIVHDFTDLKPATAESRMESFRRSQPLTFKLVNTVIICGSLEDQAKLDMTEEDKARLIIFLEKARMQPRENSTNRSFSVGSFFGLGKS